MAFSHAFIDFGCPRGSERESLLKLANVFFAVRNFDAFRALRPERMAAEAGAPES